MSSDNLGRSSGTHVGGQMNLEHRTGLIAFHLHRPAVLLGNAFHECETETPSRLGTLRFSRAIVRIKQVRYVFRSDRNAFVPHGYNGLVSRTRTANLDLRASLTIFDGVAYEIQHGSADKVRISDHH